MNAIDLLKKINMLDPNTASMVIRNPKEALRKIETAMEISNQFSSSFEIPDDSANGPLKIALTEKNRPIGIFPEECHLLITGQTGCGKTTLLKILFAQILYYTMINPCIKICSWIFTKAMDFRTLLQFNKDILVVLFREIKINPLEPPYKMRVLDWIGVIADLFQAFRIWEGSKAFLMECLKEVYSNFSGTGYYPSFFDLYDYIKKKSIKGYSRERTYQEGILTKLGALLEGPLGYVFDCSRGHTNRLVKSNVIFEVPFLANEHQIFITNYLITYLYFYKLLNEPDFRNWIALDDANNIFDSSYENRPEQGLPIIHQLLTTVRKGKINIAACSQTPHQIGASMHSNSFAKMMFSLSNGKDIEVMQKSMGIRNPEQKDYCYRLAPHEAVVKFSSRYTEPFLARVPEVKI